jgi:UDP-N-acetylmuramate: L-alanyl-gamma-D-glutamyl-meso-diaminopimelate ligase
MVSMRKLPGKVHVIGICGVATSALAIAFHKKGVKVTGSDKGFFPPVSTELEKHGVPFYAGWHPEKMIANGLPDAVIVGTASGSQNPETALAKERRIPIYSFAEAIGEFFTREKSIVCVGTWGKTSSTALLSYILEHAGLDPTYMFGGVSRSHEASAKLGSTDWSIFEGDEYKSSPTDPTAKFFYYKPTHLLLTAVSWDHADLYPTEKDYFAAFDRLVSGLPASGFIVGCGSNPGVIQILESYKGRKVLYGKRGTAGANYSYDDVHLSREGLDLTIKSERLSRKVHSPILGDFQAENITGCFAMAREFGIEPEKIIEAISTFKGLKRRLEKRYEGAVTVIDDIAHSPEKAAAVLSTLRSIYSGKIIAIFEPNIGGRRREAQSKFDDAFKDADFVVIPRLTKLKVSDSDVDQPMEGVELARIIQKTKENVSYIDDDLKVVEFLVANAKEGDIIVFLGSHGFRGMIEGTITSLHRQSQS